MMDVNFKVGDTFSSFEELKEKLKLYKAAKHISLQTRDSRSTDNKRVVKKLNPALKYYELKYMCSLGGRSYKSRSQGKRNVTSFKQGCEMHIRFAASEDGSRLVVKSLYEEHNHEINEGVPLRESLHPELCAYISKLVSAEPDIGLDEVKRRLNKYVCDEMFKGQTLPLPTRRQYFPSTKQVRYVMTKAIASLKMDGELEVAQSHAKKLKESRKDEKMIFNFKMKKESVPPSRVVDSGRMVDAHKESSNETLENGVRNDKLLFCHQTPHQQRLMKRYGSQLIFTQISSIHTKSTSPLFCLYVQTNVDFQIVGEFIPHSNATAMVVEGLRTFKEWNPGWNPKCVVVDFSEGQIDAAEKVFPGASVLVSDLSREKAWFDWLNLEENGVTEHKEEITGYLRAIVNSYTEDMMNAAAKELEESHVWKSSEKLRSWFKLDWLSQAKRWVVGYRPDDYLMCSHLGRTLEEELKVFESIRHTDKYSPVQSVIQHIVEHVAPLARRQHEALNKESMKLQKKMGMNPDIPKYLSYLPAKLTSHIHERLKSASQHSYTLVYLHPGIFSVQGPVDGDNILHTVSFGDLNTFPNCECRNWQLSKLPCLHMCAVFNSYPGWSWDMLSVAYRSSPVFHLDWSFTPEDDVVDKSTQTSDYTPVDTASCTRVVETPLVLASQCRGLLTQLSKLPLAHHGPDNLYRLRSELKELISLFSGAPKLDILSSPDSITDTTQTKGPSRSHSEFGEVQSVFAKNDITPAASRQINNTVERNIFIPQTRLGPRLPVARPPVEPIIVPPRGSNTVGTVYMVDPTGGLLNTKDKNSVEKVFSPFQLKYLKSITQNKSPSTVDEEESVTSDRKRLPSKAVFLNKPPNKRAKDKMTKDDRNFLSTQDIVIKDEVNCSIYKDSLQVKGLSGDNDNNKGSCTIDKGFMCEKGPHSNMNDLGNFTIHGDSLKNKGLPANNVSDEGSSSIHKGTMHEKGLHSDNAKDERNEQGPSRDASLTVKGPDVAGVTDGQSNKGGHVVIDTDDSEPMDTVDGGSNVILGKISHEKFDGTLSREDLGEICADKILQKLEENDKT